MTADRILIAVYLAATVAAGLAIHEYAHAFVAMRLGDPTPKQSGRLTLDLRPHVDPFGTLLLPAILLFPVLFGRLVFPVFAYAKPMPLNLWTLRRRDRDATLIALAGPVANTILAFGFGGLLRLVTGTGQFFLFLRAGLIANVTLAVMNLIPIPGLDGSRVVARFLPPRAREVYSGLDQYCALFILVVVFIFSGPVIAFLQAIGNGICSLAAGSSCFS